MESMGKFLHFKHKLFLTLLILIILLPILGIIKIILNYSVDIPWQDDWYVFVPYIDNIFTGNFNLEAFWHHANNHGTFFLKIIGFAIIYLSKWQSFYFGIASVLCNLIIFCILAIWVKRLINFYKPGRLFYLIFPLLSLVIFSASYGFNWVFNTALLIFITNAAVVSLFFFLTREQLRWQDFSIAVFMAIIAANSYMNGLSSLCIGFFILLYYRIKRKNENNLPLIIWTVVAILLTGTYFIGYHSIETHPSPFAFLSNIKYHLDFFFTLVGYPVSLYSPNLTLKIGILGIIWFFSVFALFLRNNRNNIDVILPFFLMGIYSLISALMISMGRAELGISFAYKDRYTLITIFLWISNIVISTFFLVGIQEKYKLFVKMLASLVIFIVIFTFSLRYVIGLNRIQEFSYKLSMAEKGILEGKTTPETNEYLRGYMPLKLELLPVLKKYSLSLYRKKE